MDAFQVEQDQVVINGETFYDISKVSPSGRKTLSARFRDAAEAATYAQSLTPPPEPSGLSPECETCHSSVDVARRVRLRQEQTVFIDECGDVLCGTDWEEEQEIEWNWICMECGDEWGGASGPCPDLA